MKIIYIILVSLVLLGVVGSCKNKTGSVKAQFANSKIELGRLTEGEKKKGFVILKNIGNSDLVVKDVASGCVCTQLVIDKKTIKPGSEAKISYSLTVGHFDSSGTLDVPIIVRSNDKDVFSEVYLKCTASKRG